MPLAPPPELIETLVNAGHLSKPDSTDPMQGGRTNHVWKLRTDGVDLLLKLFDTSAGSALFPNDPDAEIACLAGLGGSGLAPRLRASGQSDAGRWILYDFQPGAQWRVGSERVADVLRRLHDHAPVPNLRRAPNGSAALARQTAAILEKCPTDGPDLMDRRPSGPAVPATGQLALLHGDPVPGNILVSGDRTVFIDWQCPALGDPCNDIAVFLSPSMQLLYRGRPLDAEEERAFLTAYNHPGVTARYVKLRPWFHWRMAAHCLWRAQTGHSEYLTGYQLELAALDQLAALAVPKPE